MFLSEYPSDYGRIANLSVSFMVQDGAGKSRLVCRTFTRCLDDGTEHKSHSEEEFRAAYDSLKVEFVNLMVQAHLNEWHLEWRKTEVLETLA